METQIQQIFNVITELDSPSYIDDVLRPFILEHPILHFDNFSSPETQALVGMQLSTLVTTLINEHIKRLKDENSRHVMSNMQLEAIQEENYVIKGDILELNQLVSHKDDQIQKLYKGIEESERKMDELQEKITKLQHDVFNLREKNMQLEMAREPPSVIERKHTQSLIELERFMNDNDQLEIENMQLKETLYQARVEIAQLSGRNLGTFNTPWLEEHQTIVESLNKSSSSIEVVKKLSFEEESPENDMGEITQDESPEKILKVENEIVRDLVEKNREVEREDVESRMKKSGYEKIMNESPEDADNLTDPITYKGSGKSTRNNSDSITPAQKEELLGIKRQFLSVTQTEPVVCESTNEENPKRIVSNVKERTVQTEYWNLFNENFLSSSLWGKKLKTWFLMMVISMMFYVFFVGRRQEYQNCAELW